MSLGNNLGLNKTLVMTFKKLFLLLDTSFKILLKRLHLVKKNEGQFWLNSDGLKILTMNPMEK